MKILTAVAIILSILIFSFYKKNDKNQLPETKLLEVPLVAQVGHYWCWAACLEMVMNYHSKGFPFQQCEIATTQINRHKSNTEKKLDCITCLSEYPVIPNCDQAIGSVEDIRDLLHTYNYSARDTNALSWEIIKQEIASKKPIIAVLRNPCVDYRDTCKPSHAVVIIGISETREQAYLRQEIIVNDPKSDSFCKGQTRKIVYNIDIKSIICRYIWDIKNAPISKSIY